LWRYLLHWGLAPTLFLLPSWLGLSRHIHGVIESGTILYAWPIYWLGIPSHNAIWEFGFVSRLPPILEPLCQHPWLDAIGMPELHMIGAFHGPLSAIYAGLFAIAFILFCAAMNKYSITPWREAKRPRGFDVLPAKDTTPPGSP
jgi:hypothetical protein